jgi:hypothetical protein
MIEHPHARLTAANDEQLDNSEVLFDGSAGNPSLSSETFSLGVSPQSDDSKPLKQAEVAPLHASDFSGSETKRAEFITGAEMLGLNTTARPLQAQQFAIADMLNASHPDGAPLNVINGVVAPRRSSKTTTIYALILGRCVHRPGFQAAVTGVTQVAARTRFLKDVVAPLERAYPDPETRDFKVNRSAGSTHISFSNGSFFGVVPPNSEAIRGESLGFYLVDEGQEVRDPDDAADLLAGVLPTFDTNSINGKTDAQLVVAGTADEAVGLLWDVLESGRAGKAGIIEYAADPATRIHHEDDDPEELPGSSADPAVWLTAHPGIGNLTPISAIRRNFDTLRPEVFASEYLGLWKNESRNTFLDPVKWAAGAIEGPVPAPPARFGLGMSVHRDQTFSAICAAWRDEDGNAVIAILDHRKGVNWVVERASYFSNKYKVPITHDPMRGSSSMVAEGFKRITPRPRLDPLVWAQVSNASELLVTTLNDSKLKHFSNQSEMDDAVRLVIKRRAAQGKRWAIGTRLPEEDATVLEAASFALRAFDELPVKRPLPRTTAA